MKRIDYNNATVAIVHHLMDWKQGLDFLTSDNDFIQTGTWFYQEGMKLKAHRHITNTRKIDRTQETIIILSGSLMVDFYDDANTVFASEILASGDICVILNIGHGYQILENNTRVVEVKNGPFVSVEADKQLI
jgi:hypothetical protein